MSLPARPARNDAGPREAPADQTRTKEIEAGSLLRAAQNAYFVPKKIHAYAAETGERQDKTVHDYNGERLTYAGFQRYIAPERTAGVPGQLSERLHAAQRPDPGIHTYNGQTLQQAGFRSYMNIRRKPGS